MKRPVGCLVAKKRRSASSRLSDPRGHRGANRRLVYRCFRGAGTDRVAGDAVREPFERDGARETEQRRLGGDVGDAVGRALEAVDRRHVEDAAPAARLHHRHRQPDQVKGGRQVHRQPLVPLLGAEGLDRGGVPHHGVVDQDVDAAERGPCGFDDARRCPPAATGRRRRRRRGRRDARRARRPALRRRRGWPGRSARCDSRPRQSGVPRRGRGPVSIR